MRIHPTPYEVSFLRILFVNGEYRGNDDVGKLMEDFFCTTANDMHSNVLADRVRYFKETEKGAENMCKIVEDLCKEAKDEGLQRGRQEGVIKNLCDLVHDKLLSVATAVSRSGLSEAEFASWMNHFYPQS